ncbi:AI-2E family transporter [Rhizobium leguminosarum]|jgi:predicted PurR-regulated permease PerM|uniref:AI-2E family transporter n=1 Tax=Rhizobium leguminosarum TaxID=384 RepID=A0A4Q8XPQ9_RHILE|nr:MULTISPECIES: AI-2E family transporter [Rhizobium]KPN26851.1 transporter [Rhizobium brockwellii]MDV4157786.1 AI-2E family transporter [Rhizobium brockwellii]NZD50615.1 AI-2E family transporter [Rhizobium leguminosarum]QIO51155.1 AI-2E family transporter [Rhizobium leguminosarum bv. trifolii]QJX05930.1 AI-2E family transporter [Rhizobium brockwellii]
MTSSASHVDLAPSRPSVIHAAVQLGLVAFLVYVCARIILPFMGILLWSVILAVMLHPLHLRLSGRLGNRWSASLIGMVGVAVVLVPMFVVVTSLGSSIYWLVSGLQNHSLTIPPPPTRLADLPVVGAKLSEGWSLAAANLPSALRQYGEMLSKPAAWLASFAGGLAAGSLSFVLSIAIAAVLVAYARSAAAFALSLLEFVTNSKARGARLIHLTATTIRGVAVGVVGVAVIQSLLVGIGFFAIGVPAASALTLVTFLLAVVQIPPLLLTLPVMAYVFATEATTPAIIFAIWSFVAGLSDNLLKPLMLGRGSGVPMPVILVGVIGGMIADGLLGIFVGPVLLAVGFVLLMEWLHQRPVEDAPQIEGPAP